MRGKDISMKLHDAGSIHRCTGYLMARRGDLGDAIMWGKKKGGGGSLRFFICDLRGGESVRCSGGGGGGRLAPVAGGGCSGVF